MNATEILTWLPSIVPVVTARASALAAKAKVSVTLHHRIEAARFLMNVFAQVCGLATVMTVVDLGARFARSRNLL